MTDLQTPSERKRPDLASFELTRANTVQRLLEARAGNGAWVGELSSSALSTATAVAALAVLTRARPELEAETSREIEAGTQWLSDNINGDGGYGDTCDSKSNLSTTILVWMSFHATQQPDHPAAQGAGKWIERELGGVDAESLKRGLEGVYGEDRTFAVPILVACAIAEVCPDLWSSIPSLPFELAALPQGLFRFLGLPVVSYALPALIGIGQALHHRAPSKNPFARLARSLVRSKTLRTLKAIQPTSGGYLEATPLTSFVVMSLVAAGKDNCTVVDRGHRFLLASMRPDGSWPIDTDLSTWATTLAIQALDSSGHLATQLSQGERASLTQRLLSLQGKTRHPYTGASSGAWAWTDKPGGVPDADDTAGALLALRALGEESDEVHLAAAKGVRWLLDLANRDGGTPTFCRGWGKLPFDQSTADLTAHAMRALDAWGDSIGPKLAKRAERAGQGARAYLLATQRSDGAWVPLWFGNQDEPKRENPLYGTARVLLACQLAPEDQAWRSALQRAVTWLLGCQGSDGGFGAAPGLTASIEETALALEALHAVRLGGFSPREERVGASEPGVELAIGRATAWLVQATKQGTFFPARPIGLYFAQLWYSEELYPLLFTASALRETSNEPQGSLRP